MQSKVSSYYGQEPEIIAQNIVLYPSEMCFVQYLPIKMSKKEGLGVDHRVPENLKWTQPLIDIVKPFIEEQHYVYLTAKYLYVLPNNMGNRAGWHCDGFLTSDINYIWTDNFDTHFAIQHFDLSQDCDLSIEQMNKQVYPHNIVTYGVNNLIKLDQYNVHRSPVEGQAMRAFVKISVSEERYNLQGNAHNYLFDYLWDMKIRSEKRNHPY